MTIAHKLKEENRHRFPNPFCPKCGYRTYPRWGTHVCRLQGRPVSTADLKKIGSWAGWALSNYDFYRVPIAIQAEALAYALAYTLGRNTKSDRAVEKFRVAIPHIEALITQQRGLDPQLAVRALGQIHRRVNLKIRRARP